MLENRIQEDIKIAMKEGRKDEVLTLRMAMNSIKNKKIEERLDKLDDVKVLQVLQKLAKQHNESIEKFKEGGRDDLIEKEQKELRIIEKYLPQPMSTEELDEIIERSIEELGASSPKDMGAVMKDVIGRTEGRADGKIMSLKVKEKLS